VSEIRTMVGESIARMLSEQVTRELQLAAEGGAWQQALWALIEDSGFTKVLVPESLSGAGGGWPDAYPVLHAVGFYRVPLPLVETVVGNDLLARTGLPVEDGAVCLVQQGQGARIDLTLSGGDLVVRGTAPAAPWARHARRYVVAGQAGGRDVIALVSADASGITLEHKHNVAHEPRDDVTFASVKASAWTHAPERLVAEPVRLFGALARSIAMAGALQSVLEQCVQYAKERVQFGRPIAKFQAVQHLLAQLACETTAASTAVQAACNAMHLPDPRFEIAVAKVRVGQAAGTSARIAHQVHGAFGMTYDHTLHFGTRRVWAWRTEYGSESTWAMELGAQAIRRGGANFWRDLTARTVV